MPSVSFAATDREPSWHRRQRRRRADARILLRLGNLRLQTEEDHPAEAGHEHWEDADEVDRCSGTSWCTMSEASTTAVDYEGFAYGPLNANEYGALIPEHIDENSAVGEGQGRGCGGALQDFRLL